jgi:ABC-type antimicrobial peptide transport system permease subunit
MFARWIFWRRRRKTNDFSEEIRSHLELEAVELETEDMTKEEAERMARVGFGNVAAAQERFNLRHRVVWIDNMVQDVKYGLRAMAKSKGFMASAVLTLALGIGANTAIFSLINAVLLRSLPVEEPNQLYFVRYSGDAGVGIAPPYPYFERVQAQTKSFSGVAAFNGPGDMKIRMNGNIERANGSHVSGDFFGVLGLRPAAGRLLTPADQKLNPAAAVISYDYWQKRFGEEASAVGTTFVLDATQFTIVGVMPRGFKGMKPGSTSDYVLPMTTMLIMPHDGAGMLADTNSPWFEMVGRLKPGVQPEQALAETNTIFQAYFKDYPVPPEMQRSLYREAVLVSAARGLDYMRKDFSKPLVALMALGAGRSRLFRQLLVETALLFAAGMGAGALAAWYAVKALTVFFASGARPIHLDAYWDWRVPAFTVGISMLATVVFGAAPILRAVRTDPQTALKDGAKSSGSRGQVDLGRMLVVLQVSLSLVLLVGAMLFLRTLRNLHAIDTGFRPEPVVVTTAQLLESSYGQEAARVIMWDRLLDAVKSLPGVESASVSEMTPLDTSGRHVGFSVPGPHPEDGLSMNTVSEDYFKTLEAPLLRGRSFTSGDDLQATHVAVLNASAAKRYFGERDPIGTTVHVNDAAYRIVGVVRDIKEADLRKEAGALIYLPMRQPYDRNFSMTLSVKTAADQATMITAIEKQVRAVGPDTLVTHTGTMVEQIDDTLVQERLISGLTAAFGVLALLLSAVGLYGVLAYSVVRRTQEIGIRLALGEMPGQVLRGILGETAWLVGVGLAVGIPTSMLAARAAASLMYGVSPKDMWAQMTAASVLAAVGLAASFIPAYRASRINPLEALRYE